MLPLELTLIYNYQNSFKLVLKPSIHLGYSLKALPLDVPKNANYSFGTT